MPKATGSVCGSDQPYPGSAIRRSLSQVLHLELETAVIRVETVDEMAREKSGKFRIVTSLLTKPQVFV
jgi:hypothetical protein